jgi:hypothetical protein
MLNSGLKDHAFYYFIGAGARNPACWGIGIAELLNEFVQ